MSVQITIVGLGQIGSSIGLALKAREVNVHRVGHDKDPQAGKEAQRIGAVDDVKYNLPSSVRDAKIVILALPLAEVRETLRVIAADLQEGTLVLDTAPSKATVTAWAKELLPPGRYYIGLTPAINPDYLHGIEFGVKAARADLFEKGLIVVNAPMGTPGNVFNLTMELVNLLGAMPLLMDTSEADGIYSGMHVLPQLAAAALLDMTVDQPGWQEARKIAGRPYAAVTAGAAYHDDVLSLAETALENRENVVRLLNAYITSLINLRDEIDDNDRESVLTRLTGAWKGRVRWLDERVAAEWLKGEAQQIDAPSFGDRVNQMLFGSMLTDRPKLRK
ncbi:MAG TPA: prephenate dehydrogenase/arogenate dehydrogenase family protein [Anaerolineales bacterium]|nr:prephenate dehydrogenase/arogenate dehydrogenase family protein [Anaerolineales bacterium]